MIELNLLPIELRRKIKKQGEIPWMQIVIGVVCIVVLTTVWAYIDYLSQKKTLNELEKRWTSIQPQYQELTALQKSVEGPLKQEKDFMVQFVTSEKPLTNLISWGSEFLPEGVWLTELHLQRAGEVANVTIRGLALPAHKQSSIEQIELFLQKMREKMPDSNLSLTTTRQMMDDFELTQFTAVFVWGKAADSK
jgi:Tfp pilus assembly protein PilN